MAILFLLMTLPEGYDLLLVNDAAQAFNANWSAEKLQCYVLNASDQWQKRNMQFNTAIMIITCISSVHSASFLQYLF